MSAVGHEEKCSVGENVVCSSLNSRHESRHRGNSLTGHFQTSSHSIAAPSSCTQFFLHALHRLWAIWVRWNELRVCFEVSQCLLQTALLHPRNAAVVIGAGMFRIEQDCFGIVRDGPVKVALVGPGDAAVEVGNGIF